jgi:hypothetical protein
MNTFNFPKSPILLSRWTPMTLLELPNNYPINSGQNHISKSYDNKVMDWMKFLKTRGWSFHWDDDPTYIDFWNEPDEYAILLENWARMWRYESPWSTIGRVNRQIPWIYPRTFQIVSVDYDESHNADDVATAPQTLLITLNQLDSNHLEGSTDMQDIADLLIEEIVDETGYLVEGFYFKELMPDGSLKELTN